MAESWIKTKEKPKSWITKKKPKESQPKSWITKKEKSKKTEWITKKKKPTEWITKKKPKKRQHKGISEKSHSQVPKKYPADKHGRFKGKVFDASPIQLAKSGMTESKRYGTPIYSKTFKNGKLTKVGEGTGGTTKTSFKGWNKKDSKGLKKGGRAGYQSGGRTNLLEELGRVEAEPSNRNRRAEISRVHRELNKGYKSGGAVLKGKKVGIQIK